MKYRTAHLPVLFMAVLAGVVLTSSAQAVTIDGSSGLTTLSGTTAGAWVDGFGQPIQSSFNVNFLVVDGPTKTSLPLYFKDVPYTTVIDTESSISTRYFVFVYDAQESGSTKPVTINNVTIKVDNNTVWSSTEPIYVNQPSATQYTLTPQGNGADLALYIPVSLFDNLNLTGNSIFTFSTTQSDYDGGNDEWIFTDGGVVGTVQKFSANQSITSGTTSGGVEDPVSAVPEPGSAVLMALGVAAVAMGRCRR